MAADNRNFVNKFANEGGGDVLVEDKRLEELKSATAKTASQISTSTDYVPLQDTDGNLVKINPASFEEAVRNVLGSLLANNDKGTTISGIPALSGSGASLDFGSVTPANLASVLGVKLILSDDFDNPPVGFAVIQPSGIYEIGFSIKRNNLYNVCYQLKIHSSTDGGHIYQRVLKHDGYWTNWEEKVIV